ncbi:hypothetical protein UlMin_015038 [Ulmus minor]
MEEEVRPWDNLLPEILEQIFGRCSLQDKFCVIPSVCKSWKRVLTGPSCWQEIDILKWSTDVDNGDRICMLYFLLMRNSGLLKTLSICCTLKMPMSFLSDSIVIENASKLSNLRFLDVSYCSSIGAPALEAIGKHCKHLTGLRRTCEKIRGKYFDEEAFAIAATMPNLKRLEIPKLVYLTATPVLTILSCCTHLEFLDVIESYYVGPEKNCRFKFYWMILSRQRRDVVIRC